MKSRIIILAIASFIMVQTIGAQKYSQLKTLDGYNFQVYYSPNCDDRAKLISTRVEKAKDYFEKLLDFNAAITLLVLSDFTGLKR